MNDWKRKTLAITAIVLLSTPSALGVYTWLQPLRGNIAAAMAATGFELAYLSLSLLVLSGDLRAYAQRTAYTAVIVAVLLNVCLDYATKTGGLTDTAAFVATFDVLSLLLSIVESLPAVLAFLIASLMHRLHEQEQTENAQQTLQDTNSTRIDVLQESIQVLHDHMSDMTSKTNALQDAFYTHRGQIEDNKPKVPECPHCGALLKNNGEKAAAVRWGYCPHCKDGTLNGNGHTDVELEDTEVIA